jgi:hypothetical protein
MKIFKIIFTGLFFSSFMLHANLDERVSKLESKIGELNVSTQEAKHYALQALKRLDELERQMKYVEG